MYVLCNGWDGMKERERGCFSLVNGIRGFTWDEVVSVWTVSLGFTHCNSVVPTGMKVLLWEMNPGPAATEPDCQGHGYEAQSQDAGSEQGPAHCRFKLLS